MEVNAAKLQRIDGFGRFDGRRRHWRISRQETDHLAAILPYCHYLISIFQMWMLARFMEAKPQGFKGTVICGELKSPIGGDDTAARKKQSAVP